MSPSRLATNRLGRDFYRRNGLRLARALLGKVVVHRSPGGVTAGRIVEVEAYRGPGDKAAHSFGGRRTPRTETMWGPEGHLYVYFVYGMHWCMNVVAGREGVPEAVLIRGLEPLEGLQLIRSRRGVRPHEAHLLQGPANLCKGMGVDGSLDGADLTGRRIHILDAPEVPSRQIRRTPRIGVAYAGVDAALPWRLYLAGSRAVSGPTALRGD